MKTIYRLRDNLRFIKDVQEASLHRKDAGFKITHGLFGSDEWWAHIEKGSLPTITIRGVISSIYMSGHNDWPEFEITSESGEKSRWTRELSERSWAREYQEGRSVELVYVSQKFKNALTMLGEDSKTVLEIRVGNKKEPNQAAQTTPGLRPSVSDL